jgi:hypothetical protein
MEGGAVEHNFERDTPRDHLCQVWTPYIDASFQVWLHLAKLFQRKDFFNISQSEKRINPGGHVPLVCNLQSRSLTHAVLMIDLYELLGNPTT